MPNLTQGWGCPVDQDLIPLTLLRRQDLVRQPKAAGQEPIPPVGGQAVGNGQARDQLRIGLGSVRNAGAVEAPVGLDVAAHPIGLVKKAPLAQEVGGEVEGAAADLDTVRHPGQGAQGQVAPLTVGPEVQGEIGKAKGENDPGEGQGGVAPPFFGLEVPVPGADAAGEDVVVELEPDAGLAGGQVHPLAAAQDPGPVQGGKGGVHRRRLGVAALGQLVDGVGELGPLLAHQVVEGAGGEAALVMTQIGHGPAEVPVQDAVGLAGLEVGGQAQAPAGVAVVQVPEGPADDLQVGGLDLGGQPRGVCELLHAQALAGLPVTQVVEQGVGQGAAVRAHLVVPAAVGQGTHHGLPGLLQAELLQPVVVVEDRVDLGLEGVELHGEVLAHGDDQGGGALTVVDRLGQLLDQGRQAPGEALVVEQLLKLVQEQDERLAADECVQAQQHRERLAWVQRRTARGARELGGQRGLELGQRVAVPGAEAQQGMAALGPQGGLDPGLQE